VLAVGLVVVVGLFSGFAYGYMHQHFRELAPSWVLGRLLGRWRPPAPPADLPPGLWGPYDYGADPSDGARGPDATAGVVLHDPTRACDGVNLCLSAHAPAATLMAMDGAVLHTWSYDVDAVWPADVLPEGATPDGRAYWREAHLFENGDLLVLHDGLGLAKIDADGAVIWTYPGGCRHDFAVAEDGRIYVLATEPKVLPRVHATNTVWEDFVVVLDLEGNELRRVSLLECFENSVYAPLLTRMGRWGDLLHTNAIEVLGQDPAGDPAGVPRGSVLVSAFMLDTVAAIDLEAERVVWALTGLWTKPRDAAVLEDGRLLVVETRHHRGVYGLLELDPLTQRIGWTHELVAPGIALGQENAQCQRLPNGNTLVVERENGRAVEITTQGETVWEFRNPERVRPENGAPHVAFLTELTRLPADFPRHWCKGGAE